MQLTKREELELIQAIIAEASSLESTQGEVKQKHEE